MQIVRQLLAAVGMGQPLPVDDTPDYTQMMNSALERMRLAEIQICEAGSLEELDCGRANLQSAQAEMVQLIRTAKKQRGMSLRPISECEEMHRRLVEHMTGQGTTSKRRSANRSPA